MQRIIEKIKLLHITVLSRWVNELRLYLAGRGRNLRDYRMITSLEHTIGIGSYMRGDGFIASQFV